MAAARGTRLEAYIVLSLLSGMQAEEVRALRWDHVVVWVSRQWQPVAEAEFDHEQVAVLVWRAGRAGVTPRRRSPGGRWRCRVRAWRHWGAPGAAGAGPARGRAVVAGSRAGVRLGGGDADG